MHDYPFGAEDKLASAIDNFLIGQQLEQHGHFDAALRLYELAWTEATRVNADSPARAALPDPTLGAEIGSRARDLLIRVGDAERASGWDRALRQLAEDAFVHGFRVEAWDELNPDAIQTTSETDFKELERLYEAAWELRGKSPNAAAGAALAALNRALLLEGRGRNDEAYSWYTRAYSLAELGGLAARSAAQAALNAGVIRAQAGRLDEAAEWYEQAWALRHTSSEAARSAARAATNLGIAHESKDCADAARWYERAWVLRDGS